LEEFRSVKLSKKIKIYTNSWYFYKNKKIMGRNTSILLGDYFEKFVSTEVASGKYNSASEVIRTALRLLESEEVAKKNLVDALIKGEKSGFVKDFNREAFLKKLHEKHL
jgi:antitoxin ParD1/3/4